MPLFPILITLLLGSTLAWIFFTEHTLRSALVILIPLLWLLLMSLWWALRQRGQRLRRMGIILLAWAVLAVSCIYTLRIDGTQDGAAWLSLSFVWQEKAVHGLTTAPQAAPTSELAPTPAGVRDMPRFLGEKGDGVLPAAEFSTDWAGRPPREVWRIPMGAGWSGFAVVGNRAVTQEQRGELECVTCYELSSGRLLWSHGEKAFFTELMGGDGPRATPTVDAASNAVFTVGATGLLHCLDLSTGAKKWQADVLKDAGATKNLEWGKSASPLLTTAHVICSGGDNGASLVAYDRNNGQLAWKAGKDGGSYASPVQMRLDGREQIITVNRHSVSGHDPSAANVLWTFDWPETFPKVAQPVALNENELLITSSYGVKSHRLRLQNGRVTVVWAESTPRTKFSSVSVFGSHAYALDEGMFCCVNLENGERLWREGRYGYGQQIRIGEELILLQAEKGPVVLIRPDPAKLIEIARMEALSSKTWNPPTLAGRWLLLRNDREAVCYELQSK